MKRECSAVLLVCALIMPLAGCGEDGTEGGGPVTGSSHEPIPTARLGPPANPRKETRTLALTTTGWVGGLRLGAVGASGGTGTVAVLDGHEVPAEETWRVSGKAGTTGKLANGYTVTIDGVAEKAGGAEPGAGGGSVTVTVTPPA